MEDEEYDNPDIDVLDIMDSLKDQFENLEQRYKTYREGKSKYKTGKLATDINNNKSILDFMSPSKKNFTLPVKEEEKDSPLIVEDQNSLFLADEDLFLGLNDPQSDY